MLANTQQADSTLKDIQQELTNYSKNDLKDVLQYMSLMKARKKAKKTGNADKKFHKAMQAAMSLDRDLDPVIGEIQKRIDGSLQNETDRELFAIYPILQIGSTLSMFAPRHLVAADLSHSKAIQIYVTWARKAEKLLKASQSGKAIGKPATPRKAQNRGSAGARKAEK